MVSTPKVEENLAAGGEARRRGRRTGGEARSHSPNISAFSAMRDTDKVAARERDGRRGRSRSSFRDREAAPRMAGRGSVPLECADPRKVRNSCLVYARDGRRVARYDRSTFRPGARGGTLRRGRNDRSGHPTLRNRSPFGRFALRCATTCAFPSSIAHSRRWTLSRSLGLYRDHGTSALGDAAAGASDRNLAWVLAPPKGKARERPADLTATHGGRSWARSSRAGRRAGVVMADIDPLFQTKMRLSPSRARSPQAVAGVRARGG